MTSFKRESVYLQQYRERSDIVTVTSMSALRKRDYIHVHVDCRTLIWASHQLSWRTPCAPRRRQLISSFPKDGAFGLKHILIEAIKNCIFCTRATPPTGRIATMFVKAASYSYHYTSLHLLPILPLPSTSLPPFLP